MGQSRKRSQSNKEKEKGKGKGKASRRSNERDVQIQTDDVTPQGQSPAPRSNESTSTQSSENSGSSFFEHISDSAITGGTFQQTNGPSNSVTIELNVNHYPPTQDSNTSQSATISQPSPPLQPSSSQNVLTGLSSSPVDARQCTSPSSDLPQQKTNYDIYKEQLELQRRGIPLWIPESNGCLPMIYQRTGVTIGDIGIVTPSGAFSFVFNICLPRDHPSQPDDLPEDFEPMSLRPRDIRKFPEFKSGSHLASKAIHKVTNDGRSTDLVFESNASEGAILTLPDGFVAHDLENLPQIQAYAAANIESWYRYINGTCGRQAKNGEIRLVIGCDKTTSWGMAVIDSPEQPTHHQLRFRPVESGTPSTSSSSPIPLHTWDYAGFVDAKVGPYPEDIALLREDDDSAAATTGKYSNQCLFIRTLNLTLRDDIFASINDELALALTKGWSSFTSTSYSSTNSSSSNINEHSCEGANQAPHGTNFGTQRGFNANIGDERVTITTSPTAKKSHPSDALNRTILDKAPGCRVAITRDEHWCSVINEDDECMPSAVQLAERVLKSYDIVQENGVAFLEHKKQNALSTSASYPVSSSDVHRSELNISHRFDGVTKPTLHIVAPDDAPDLSLYRARTEKEVRLDDGNETAISKIEDNGYKLAVEHDVLSAWKEHDLPYKGFMALKNNTTEFYGPSPAIEQLREEYPQAQQSSLRNSMEDDRLVEGIHKYQRHEVAIGDVGIVTPSDDFMSLICIDIIDWSRDFPLIGGSDTSLAFPSCASPPPALFNVSESDFSSVSGADSPKPDLRGSFLPPIISLPNYEDYPHTYPSPPPPPLEPDKDKDRRRSLDDIRFSNLRIEDEISPSPSVAYLHNRFSPWDAQNRRQEKRPLLSTELQDADFGVFQSIVKGRKSWKTLRGREVVWPPELEAALIEGLESYQPDDSRKSRLLGRLPMRNRFISDWIFEKTGKRRIIEMPDYASCPTNN
ncbi:hypothetical protein BDN70DRAFT_575777 [Pholiota conissans]|uniref:TEA domain-containing protein n=1 Tax=Pholiota conissans TaxID=109636 RepID=A0A9P6CRR2_9AGAR|nr:hypothetical protein BDN70DRAFT_575777 [Pholiota conissans]